jgi:hypothetical protein
MPAPNTTLVLGQNREIVEEDKFLADIYEMMPVSEMSNERNTDESK